MFKITVIACLCAFLIAPVIGFVADPVKDVADSMEVEDFANSTEDVAFSASVANVQETANNFLNSKQFVLVTTEKVNWYRAAHICKFNGMELASIDSMEENNIVATLINMSGCGSGAINFWTSGNDLGAFRKWYWLANGKPMNFTNWGAGEPNNLNDSNERCVEIRFKDNAWTWNDGQCAAEFFFICEIRFN